jgi:hypothetical protein
MYCNRERIINWGGPCTYCLWARRSFVCLQELVKNLKEALWCHQQIDGVTIYTLLPRPLSQFFFKIITVMVAHDLRVIEQIGLNLVADCRFIIPGLPLTTSR